MTRRSSLHHLNLRRFHVTSPIQQELTSDVDALVLSTAARLFWIGEQVPAVVVCQHSMPQQLRILEELPLTRNLASEFEPVDSINAKRSKQQHCSSVTQAAWVRCGRITRVLFFSCESVNE